MMPTVIPDIPKSCCNLFQDLRSWTDDLPVCKDSGVGFSTNSVYREDGHRQEEHVFEDQSIHLKYDDSINLYGIFDGHDGVQLAKAALDQITAELLLGELEGKTTDEEVKQIIKQAFNTVERNYLEAIGDKLAERTSLTLELPDDLTPYEAYQKYPLAVDKLNAINTELSCGTTAVVALIYRKRLYVANVGDSRALLCRTDPDGVLRVIQLSQDHVSSNEDEVLRLITLGIPREKLHPGFRLGNQEHTRCLGHYLVKGGYKEFEELACASSEPVIAVPEIAGGIPLDNSHRFLILMSSGLYQSLEEATGTPSVNKEIAQMIVEQFRVQSTLTGVAQAVVDKVVRIHHDFYMSRTGSARIAISKREDITLLIRNFNFPLPNAISPSGPTVDFSFTPQMNPLDDGTSPFTVDSSESNLTVSSDNTTLDSSTVDGRRNPPTLPAKVKAYVDFTKFYERVEKAMRDGDLPDGLDFEF